jgi:hypothetical protein
VDKSRDGTLRFIRDEYQVSALPPQLTLIEPFCISGPRDYWFANQRLAEKSARYALKLT